MVILRAVVVVPSLFGLLCVGLLGTASAQSTLYDDFSGSIISPTRWVGSEVGGGILETVRITEDGHLRLAHRVVGAIPPTGFRSSRNRLSLLSNPNAVTAVKFDITPIDFSAVGCGAGSDLTIARAGLSGFLFNDVGNTNPVDNTGNVGVTLYVARASNSTNPPGVLRVVGTLLRCNDTFCGNATMTTVDLGLVNTSETTTLSFRWDKASKRVDFQRDAEPIQSISYSFDDSSPPSVPSKLLEARGQTPNCSTGSRPFAEASVVIDNVFVNP